MKSRFEPNRKSIEDLYYAPRNNYKIPKYQRPYSWKKEQFEEFWKLIIEGETSFIGTVIYNVASLNDDNIKEIIDGQQRYLTITILASALRNALFESYKNKKTRKIEQRAHDVHEELIGKRNKRSDKVENFLTVGASAKHYFKKNIQLNPIEFIENDDLEIHLDPANTDEEKLIYTAHNYFKQKINEKFDVIGEEDTYKLILDNMGQLFVISIEIDDYSMAFEIFESVNSQGVDLSVADLIKNQIFKNIPSSNYEAAESKWADIIENLENLGIALSPKEFLRYHWASKFEYVGDSKLYKAIKVEYSLEGKKWGDFLEDLFEDSKLLFELLTFTKGQWQQELGKKEGAKLFKYLQALKAMKAKTWLVLVLTIIRSRQKLRELGINYVKQIEKIQLFTYFYFGIMGYAGNWYWIQMYSTAQNIFKAKKKEDILKTFEDLNKHFAQKMNVTKDAFQEGFQSITYKTYPLARYTLSSIEEKLRGKESTGWDDDLVNVEHFLPQDPKEWGLKKNETKQHVNLLGNLLLISDKLNGKLGNLTCNDKLEVIHKSTTEMELLKELIKNVENRNWDFNSITSENFKAIEVRQNYLAEIAYGIWVTELRSKLGY